VRTKNVKHRKLRLGKNLKPYDNPFWGLNSADGVPRMIDLRSAPIDTIKKNSDECVCRVTFKHLPQPLRSHIRRFGTLGQLLEIPPFVRTMHYVNLSGLPGAPLL
jgi:hypothetical protein